MALNSKAQMVLRHIVTASSRLWRQLGSLGWSLFIRLSLVLY